MRIALINPEYPSPSGLGHGGIATYIYSLANALAVAGHTVHVLARKGTAPDPLHSTVEFHEFGYARSKKIAEIWTHYFKSPLRWEHGCSRAARDLVCGIHDRRGLDIVEIPEYGGLASAFVAPLATPAVIHFHTPTAMVDALNNIPATAQRKRVYAYEKKALRNAAALKCTSHALASQLWRYCDVSADRVCVIRTIMPTDEFDAIRKQPRDPNRLDILFAGRLERRKGAEIILNAINEILATDARIHLTLAGETELGEAGEYRQAIERALTTSNRSRVWFLGPVNRKELLLLYRRSALFLMPSLFENAPNALFEAMAAKLPVVGANAGGISEAIVDGKTGLLFDIHDTASLVQAIHRLLHEPALAETIAANAYAYIKQRHHPAKIAHQTVKFYQSVIESRTA